VPVRRKRQALRQQPELQSLPERRRKQALPSAPGYTGCCRRRNADAQIVLLDFNLGQIRVVEDVREIADQCLVDTVLFFSHEFCPVFLCGDVL